MCASADGGRGCWLIEIIEQKKQCNPSKSEPIIKRYAIKAAPILMMAYELFRCKNLASDNKSDVWLPNSLSIVLIRTLNNTSLTQPTKPGFIWPFVLGGGGLVLGLGINFISYALSFDWWFWSPRDTTFYVWFWDYFWKIDSISHYCLQGWALLKSV